jgi:outer membrane protein OmpA-like peptidoglycan-associated protein
LLSGAKDNAGCPRCDTDGDGVTDEKDLCPTVAGPVRSMGCPAPDTLYMIKEVAVIPAGAPTSAVASTPLLTFSNAGSALDTNMTAQLDQIAQTIRDQPSRRYVVYGFSGPSRIERQRSADQVSAVVNYLVEKQGINPERLVARGGLQGGTSNTVKVREAAEGEDRIIDKVIEFKKAGE